MRFIVFILAVFTGIFAFAQSPVAAPVNIDSDFLMQVASVIHSFGGLNMMAKIAAIITLLISSMKVSFLLPYWEKLGSLQIWVAPILGLAVGFMSLGKDITFASAFAYMSAGLGAVYLHEILDKIKLIPGLGQVYIAIIGIIEGLLGGADKSVQK